MLLPVSDPSLVVLCGPAGSGKTTFARRHFPDTTIVSSDRCRAMIADDEADLRVSPDAFELFHTIIEMRLRRHRLTVADSTALQPEARATLRQIARRGEVPVVAVLFDVPEATCLAWDHRRDRQVGRSVIHQQWERFQQALRAVPDEGFDHVVVVGEGDLTTARITIVKSEETSE